MSTHPSRRKVAIGEKLRGERKVRTIPLIDEDAPLRKPDWIRVRVPAGGKIQQVKDMLRKQKLHTVCEEAACPNLPECFSHGTATFMVMGDICTRRCAFCDVAFGRPNPLDPNEPIQLAESVESMGLSFVVITSVDRDDLKDGGAQHFVDCISAIRARTPDVSIEILTPDFRGCLDEAVDLLTATPPDVFNHNIETVPDLYKRVRPGARYDHSLKLLQVFKQHNPHIPTKSGIMVGLGETKEQVFATLKDLRAHDVDRLTIGQYLQPSPHHAPVERYVHPDEFNEYARFAEELGFTGIASGPMVRSSYHADLQDQGINVGVKEN
ncbi:MAG TPA: lipoyl synthase [Alcanivoracaceae bacterium]|nr:lipoyl synthase [Alcanivoracaceae bacterium]